MLDRILFLERCRQCRKYIEEPRSSMASTVCNSCWKEIDLAGAGLKYCDLSEHESIAVASGTAYEGLVKDLIYKFKYDDDRLIASDLVLLLDKPLSILAEKHNLDDSVLVPVPLSFFREFKRGFNQAALLSKKLSERHGLKMDSKILKRKKHTQAQHSLSKQERLKNLTGAFDAHSNSVKEKTIILVDDIYTSGATLAEAARTLLTAGATTVSAITLARALLD